jgi:hypothetical protein
MWGLPAQSTVRWVPEAVSRGVKRSRLESDHSTMSSVEIKKEGICTFIPRACLQRMDSDNFTFFFFL